MSSQNSQYSASRPARAGGTPAPSKLRHHRYGEAPIYHINKNNASSRTNSQAKLHGHPRSSPPLPPVATSDWNDSLVDNDDILSDNDEIRPTTAQYHRRQTSAVVRRNASASSFCLEEGSQPSIPARTSTPSSGQSTMRDGRTCGEVDPDTRALSVHSLPAQLQRPIRTAKLYIFALTLAINPWPTRPQADKMVDDAYAKAVAYLRAEDPSMSYPAQLVHENARQILRKKITAIRGYLAATCRKHVPHLYSLRMDDRPEDLRVQVELLLQDDRFAANKTSDGRLAYFASPQIADILEKHLFEKPDHYGRDPVLRSYFQPLRPVTISLAATAVLCALNNLRTGRNEHSLKPVPFESDIYIGHYKAFQETWENMSPVRREAICKAIYERIALRTGLRADERVDMRGHQDDFGDDTSDLTDLLPMTAEQGRLLMTGEGRPNHAHRAATGYTSQISEGRSSHEQTAIAVVPAEDGTALESIPEDRPTLVSIGRRVRNQMTQDSFISSARVRTHLRLNQDPDAVTQHPVGLGELQRSNNNPDEHQHEGPPRKRHKSSRGGPLPPSQSGKPYPSNGSEPRARSSQTCSRSSQSTPNSLMGAKRNKDDVEEDDAAYDEDYHTCHEGILGKPTEVVGDHCGEQADDGGLQDADLESQIPAVVLEGNWNASDSDDAPRSRRRSGARGRSRRAATPMRRSTRICGSNGILNKVRRERGEEKEDKMREERDGNEANGTAGAEEEDEDEQDEEYEEDEEDEEDNDDGQNDESDEEGGR